MNILYHDVVRKLPPQEAELAAVFYPDLNEMLAVSDCVILATPASPGGKRLITKERLECFKHGGRFVNIARGSLVDEEALADAVVSGRLVGVGLDVHEHEPNVNGRLKGLRQVTLTAHNAGGTLQTHMGFEGLAMRNIDAVLKGLEPLTPVNKHLMVGPRHSL
jgi:lactate dehydrogenase-like 2-hydroxyacid dehydrogenase